jgi:Tol biopolymer transport system component
MVGVIVAMVAAAAVTVGLASPSAALVGRNGALLVVGSATTSDCSPDPPSWPRARAADEPDCQGTYAKEAGLFLVGATGSPRRLAVNDGGFNDGAVSPDGRFVLFSRTDSYLHVVPSVGGSSTALREGGHRVIGCNVAWSPDGRRIAYENCGADSDCGAVCGFDAYIFTSPLIAPTLGLSSSRWLRAGQHPAWSVRGRIAYDGDGQLYSVRANGGDRVALPVVARSRGLRAYDPDWSPAGDRLTFIVERVGDQLEPGTAVFTSTATGREVHQLTPFINGGGPEQPIWSPDGRWIAFSDGSDVRAVPARATVVVPRSHFRLVVRDVDELKDWQPLSR